jgi:hypothetical protein
MSEYVGNGLLIGMYFAVLFSAFILPIIIGIAGSIIALILLIIGAYLVYKDAQDIGLESLPNVWSPTIWAIVAFIFWTIAAPVYLLKRKGYYFQREQYLASKL